MVGVKRSVRIIAKKSIIGNVKETTTKRAKQESNIGETILRPLG